MLGRESKTDLGLIRIHNEVLSTIAYIATKEVNGVAEMGGKITDGIYDILGKKRYRRGIRVEFEENEVRVDVSVVIRYGYNVQYVANQIQENVKRAIEEMTGLSLAGVNVTIQGTEIPKEQEVSSKEVQK